MLIILIRIGLDSAEKRAASCSGEVSLLLSMGESMF
jgi:hypothetical protein